MSHPISSVESVSRQLMVLDSSPKPKMLVVDDEPDNLDLLYRTFRRDFQVLRAESGVAALDILEREGEVAVIISDQRMPEMKGTEFLSKTVPQFPDTMRIILTGFTDVEDLVDAINSGQVYKYITKPWDPNELKAVVYRATETYQVLKQRTDELHRAQAETALLRTILQASQATISLDDCLTLIATAFGKTFAADVGIVHRVREQTLTDKGLYVAESADPDLAWNQVPNPLLDQAIATQTTEIAVHSDPDNSQGTQDPSPETFEYYKKTGIRTNLVMPILAQDHLLALLSLQWKVLRKLSEEDLSILHLATQQAALVLRCRQSEGLTI